MRDDTVYLRHILDAIARTETYIDGFDKVSFRADLLVQDGVIRQIEIIGEATKRLSRDVRKANRHIPWDDIAGMRDKLIHDYFGVDINTVWLTAVNDLPALKVEVEKILASMQ